VAQQAQSRIVIGDDGAAAPGIAVAAGQRCRNGIADDFVGNEFRTDI
jgi:hypothetical protein